MDLQMQGKTVLITGASQGIGAGLAQAFAEEGCHLHLVARSGDKLEKLAQGLRENYKSRIAVHAVDMSDPDAADVVSAAVGDDRIDILVNNAGSIPAGTLWEVDSAQWRDGWQAKVFGYIAMCRVFYERMKFSGSGVILNNIGNGGENPDFNYIAGSTGNAALMAFTRALGGRSLDDGIRVLGVNPGPVATDRIIKISKKRAQQQFGDAERYGEILKEYPLGRAAEVREVADLFIFLASDRSGYSSGAIFTLDGGLTSKRSI